MNNKEKQEFIEGLISGIDKASETKTRKNVYVYTTIPNKQTENLKKYTTAGWELIKNLKLKQDYD